MRRRTFVWTAVKGMAVLSACNSITGKEEDELSVPNTITLLFPSANDHLVCGALNPIRFKNPSGKPVDIILLDENETQMVSLTGITETRIAIPESSKDTTYTLLIDSVRFKLNAKVVNGHPFSLYQYQSVLDAGQMVQIQSINGIPFAVKQTASQQWEVYNLTCTHNGCMVNLSEQGIFKCGCHGSQFDSNGKVLNGPAQEALGLFSFSLLEKHEILLVWNV